MMDEMTEREREQLRRFETLRQLAWAIALRRLWISLLVFVLSAAAVGTWAYRRALKSERFEARAVLFFRPRTTERVRAMPADEVFQILFRRSLKERLAETLQGPSASAGFRRQIVRTVEFKREDRNPNVFNVIVRAATEAAAVARANAFADLCRTEYATYRGRDLTDMQGLFEARRRELQGRLDALDAEEAAQDKGAHGEQPKRELEYVGETLKRQKAALSEASIRLARETAHQKNLQAELDALPKAVVRHVVALRRFLAKAEKRDADVAEAEALYTERNPRLIVARERRAALRTAFEAFCRTNGIASVDAATLAQVERLTADIREATANTEAARETCAALQAEIARNDGERTRLQHMLPNDERIRRRREAFGQALAEIEDALSDIRYQQSSVTHDLSLVEPVRMAEETEPLSRKKITLVLMLSLALAGMSSALLVLLEIVFGRIHDRGELALHPELDVLGALPPEETPFASREEERRVLHGCCHRLGATASHARLLLIARLPGAAFSRRLREAFDRECATVDKRILRIEIVPVRAFAVTDGMTLMDGLVLKGASAFFPVQDVTRLSLGEMELLANDLKELGAKYDLYVLGRQRPLAHHSIYFEQMLQLCDAVVLFVGKGTTSRASLRQAIARQRESGKPLFAILTGERDWEEVRGMGEFA